MINPEIAAKCGTTYRGVLHMPINVCSRCGEEDDPQDTKRWPRDIDDDICCPKCLRVCTDCEDELDVGNSAPNSDRCNGCQRIVNKAEDEAAWAEDDPNWEPIVSYPHLTDGKAGE